MQVSKVLKKVAVAGVSALMFGATVTGALADLGQYPQPFGDGVAIVAGANAAASDSIGMSDIGLGLKTEGKCDTKSSGVPEEIPFGASIAGVTGFDSPLEDNDIDGLKDGTFSFNDENVDFRDMLVLGQAGKDVKVMTALTSSDDDYGTDVVLETDRAAMKYYLVFDDKVDMSKASYSEPLEVDFLGKKLKIVDIDGDSKITAFAGTEYFLDVGDEVEVKGKTVILENVGESGQVVISVDGLRETIGSSTESVNGVDVKVLETFYESTRSERSATLLIGDEAIETYTDGDAYIGEDEDDPNWVWNIGNLDEQGPTEVNDNAEFNGPYLGVENSFVWNDDSDKPKGVGECIDLPNNYIKICMDGLTDATYMDYTFSLDNDADFSDVDNDFTSGKALVVETDQEDGIVINTANMDNVNKANPKTDKLLLWKCIESGVALDTSAGIYYVDSDNDVSLAGCMDDGWGSEHLFSIDYEDTKGSDMKVFLDGNSGDSFSLVVDPYDSTDLSGHDDKIEMSFKGDEWNVLSLGNTADDAEAGELTWDSTDIGTKDNDMISLYGITIRDPESNGASDEVVLSVPSGMVQAKVSINEQAVTTCTKASGAITNKLDTEVTSADKFLILVGGPCVNSLVDDYFGITCEDWTLKPGEAMIKLAEKDGRVAMLVAGTTADDTRRASSVLMSYMDYTLKGNEVLVRGSGKDITVE